MSKESKESKKGKALGALNKLIPKADAPTTPAPTAPPATPKPNPNVRRFTAPYNYVPPTAATTTTPAAPKGSPHSPWNPSSSFRPSMPGVPTAAGPTSSNRTTEPSEPPRGYTPPAAIHPSTSPYAYRPEGSSTTTDPGAAKTPADTPVSPSEPDHAEDDRRPGTPDLSIFGARVPMTPAAASDRPAAEPTGKDEPTQQMPQATQAFEAVERAAEIHHSLDPEIAPDESADPALPSVIDAWMFEHPAHNQRAGGEQAHPSEPGRAQAEPKRPEITAWDELAPEIRSDRPARPLYRIEDPMVKDEPISAIEKQQPVEDVQLRFEDLTARYGQPAPEKTPAEPSGLPRPEPAGWRREAESYEHETRLFGDGSVVDWAAIEDNERNGTNGHTGAESAAGPKRVLQWQSGGEQVIAAERRASILKNTSAKAKVKAAEDAMIVEDGLVYVLVDDEGQPVLH